MLMRSQFIQPAASALLTLLALMAIDLQVDAADPPPPELAGRPVEQMLQQSRDAYTVLERAALAKALASLGVAAMPQLGTALGDAHWHVRHCALLALKELAKPEGNRAAFGPVLPVLGKLVTADPHHGVRVAAVECVGALAEQGKGAQQALAKAAVDDEEAWVRAAAASALAAVKADLAVMMPVYESMIRSTDKASRGSGIREASRLFEQRVDITALIPALKDVFLKPIYDANFSRQTRVPAMSLLLKLKVPTSDLVPAILSDLSTTGQVQADGYHPYQRMTLKLLGTMGADAVTAIPMLEQVAADPAKFGCVRSHPDFKGFIEDAQTSIQQIRSAANK